MLKSPVALVASLVCVGAVFYFLPAFAEDGVKPPDAAADKPSGDAKAELADLVGKVNDKIQAGKKSEEDYADELKQFDKIMDEHKGEKTEDVARVLYMKEQLLELVQSYPKAEVLAKQLKTDYPDTVPGMNAGRILAILPKKEAAAKIQDALAKGTVFPDFDVKDIDGKPLSVANYKGKVVMVDFWATWCPPCRAEMPNVIKVYEKYHDKGFEIIGISGDEGADEVKTFTATNKMPWPQYLDNVDPRLGDKYGILGIPNNFLIDRNGKIIDNDLRGDALDEAVGKAVGE